MKKAEEQYYEQKRIEEEINVAWLEKEMFDDLGWSLHQEEMEEQPGTNLMGGECQLENNEYLSEDFENSLIPQNSLPQKLYKAPKIW